MSNCWTFQKIDILRREINKYISIVFLIKCYYYNFSKCK